MLKKICIIAGEVSGDLYGEKLIKELSTRDPSIQFFGVGGRCMKTHSFDSILPIERFQVMGFSDVLKSLPQIISNFRTLKRAILSKNPDVVICIDQPDFSLRLAKAIRNEGFRGKIVQFVAPTVWAYKKHRIAILEKYFDLLLTLFPFENQYFEKSLNTVWTGHPIIEDIQKTDSAPSNIVAIFSGSRPSEIRRNFPIQIDAAIGLCKKMPHLKLGISVSVPALLPWMHLCIEEHARKHGFCPNVICIPFEKRYELMRTAHVALAKSGTVTLELALHGVPTVVTYALSSLNYLIAKYLLRLKLPYFCIVNILKEKEVFPELIKKKVTAQEICDKLIELCMNETMRACIVKECNTIRSLLESDEKPTTAAVNALYNLKTYAKA
jgi:lipid-A-disaccharide synthase